MEIQRSMRCFVPLCLCLLLVACSGTDGNGELLCHDGEIADGDECCEDINDNGICDADERADDCELNETFIDGICCVDADENGVCDFQECGEGKQLIDGTCCKDTNHNGVCDSDETAEDCEANEVFYNGLCTSDICGEDEVLIDDQCCIDADGNGVCDDDENDDDCEEGQSLVDGECCVDADGDGVCEADDCDDNDPQVYPGASEICGYPVVNDCDNPCYEDGNCEDAAVFSAIKSGQIGAYDADADAWSDVTELYDDEAAPFAPEAGEWTLAFCALTADAANAVKIDAMGEGVAVTIRSGYVAHPDLESEDVFIYSTHDEAVVTVSADAVARISDVVIRHEALTSGTNARGILCKDAQLDVAQTTIEGHVADQGAGLWAEGCDITMRDTVRLRGNRATVGGAIFLESSLLDFGDSAVRISENYADAAPAMYLIKSTGVSNAGEVLIEENRTDGPNSAAVELRANAALHWESTSDNGGYTFIKNGSDADGFFDLRIDDAASSVEMGPVTFSPATPGHVSTDTQTYSVDGDALDLVCSSSVCTF